MKSPMKWLICGGRAYANLPRVFRVLDWVASKRGYPDTIMEGGAGEWDEDHPRLPKCGADLLGRAWAEAEGIPVLEVRADWKRLGKAAGPIRNQEMLLFGPNLGIAFPGGSGTADMVRRLKGAGIEVIIVPGDRDA